MRTLFKTLLAFLVIVMALLPRSVGVLRSYTVYVPTVQLNLDPRIGITEYNCQQMELLGFSCGVEQRYHSEYWGMPSEDNTSFFVRSAHRCLTWRCRDIPESWPTELYCKFAFRFAGKHDFCTGETATETGLVDPIAMCQFLSERPWVSVIVGNEESIEENQGISSNINPNEYALMYRVVWDTVKTCSPETKVGPYAPMQQHDDEPTAIKNYFEAWRAAYQLLTGNAVPQDFQAVHFYAWPGFVLEEETAKLVAWKAWLAARVDTDAWMLTEYGFPCWRSDVPKTGPEVERFMWEFTCWLWATDHFQAWGWWKDCSLLEGGEPTPIGVAYRRIAAGCCTFAGSE